MQECAANPSTLLAATSRGGHVAFLSGSLWPLGTAFMDMAVLQFLGATLQHYDRGNAGMEAGAEGASGNGGGECGGMDKGVPLQSRL